MKNWSKVFITMIVVINAGLILLLMMGSSPDSDMDSEGEDIRVVYGAVPIPDTVVFAGEVIPLDRFDVRESLDRELLVNSYFHSQTLRFLKLAPRYFSVIEPILKERGVPDDFKYLAVAESGFNPRAVSPARAVGLWQFLQGTGREYGLEVNSEVDERYHVEKSTYAACDYLLSAYRKFGSWAMVAAAFNGGVAGIEKQMSRQKEDSYFDILFNEETARYVYRIAAIKIIMENPERYNFYVAEEEKYPIVPTRDVVITGKVDNLADFARGNGVSYKILKDFNPWLRDNFLTNSAGKRYVVKIPVTNN